MINHRKRQGHTEGRIHFYRRDGSVDRRIRGRNREPTSSSLQRNQPRRPQPIKARNLKLRVIENGGIRSSKRRRHTQVGIEATLELRNVKIQQNPENPIGFLKGFGSLS